MTTLLAAAVEGIGGTERSGQVAMAQAVQRSIATGEHLAVQAGTGTGKSLAYLVPAVAHAMATGSSVVVATATIALQRQLIDRDLPRLAAALEPLFGRAPTFAILKGRGNYLCRYRLNGGAPEEPGETLFDPAAVSAVGRQVQRLHEWAAGTETGDRDELVPGVEDRAWRQVAISAKECIGATRCPNGSECFAERARERGRACGHRGHQPRPARDRRAGGLHRAARARRGRHRRGARPGRPGHHGGVPGTVRPGAEAAARRTAGS